MREILVLDSNCYRYLKNLKLKYKQIKISWYIFTGSSGFSISIFALPRYMIGF